MRYFVILLVLIGFILPQAFATENLFYGTSSFERIPSSLTSDNPQIIEIKFQYTDGPYSLNDLKPIIDVSPKEATSYVQIEFEPIKGLYRNSIARIHGTITVDPNITSEKIFLNISYVGTDSNDVPFKSGWSDSAILDIVKILPEPEQDIPVYENCGTGTVLQDGICVVKGQTEKTNSTGIWGTVIETSAMSPLKQFKSGVSINEIKCKDNLVLVQKHDGFPACVKPVTKQNLIDRGWAYTYSLDEIQNNPDLIKQNIIRIEDGRISLYPENMCAS
jgi:hypothetical protein